MISSFEKFQAEAPDSLTGMNSFLDFISSFHSANFPPDFVDYFEDTYVWRPIHGGRRPRPRFAISMWNSFNRLDQQLRQTNNSSEGWNKAMMVEFVSEISVI